MSTTSERKHSVTGGGTRTDNGLRFRADQIIVPMDPRHPFYDKSFRHNPEHPKFRALVDSIKAKVVNSKGKEVPRGIIQNLVLREESGPQDGIFYYTGTVVVVGRRRALALKVACEELIAEGEEPITFFASLFRLTDLQALEMIVEENNQRVSQVAMSDARLMTQLMAQKDADGKPAYNIAKLAALYKKSEGWVCNTLKLMKAAPAIQDAVADGELATGTARAIIDAHPDDHKAQVAMWKAGPVHAQVNTRLSKEQRGVTARYLANLVKDKSIPAEDRATLRDALSKLTMGDDRPSKKLSRKDGEGKASRRASATHAATASA